MVSSSRSTKFPREHKYSVLKWSILDIYGNTVSGFHVDTFPKSNVVVFPGSYVDAFSGSNVDAFPGSHVDIFLGSYAE